MVIINIDEFNLILFYFSIFPWSMWETDRFNFLTYTCFIKVLLVLWNEFWKCVLFSNSQSIFVRLKFCLPWNFHRNSPEGKHFGLTFDSLNVKGISRLSNFSLLLFMSYIWQNFLLFSKFSNLFSFFFFAVPSYLFKSLFHLCINASISFWI